MERIPHRNTLRRLRLALYFISSILAVALISLILIPSPYYANQSDLQPQGAQCTALTVRINGDDAVTLGANISEAAYPKSNSAAAVTLVPEDDWQTALAATPLIADPISAPVLPIKESNIPDKILQEIERLNPQGISWDGGIEAIVIGNVDQEVFRQLDSLPLSHRHITANRPEQLAMLIDHYRGTVTGGYSEHVLVVPQDNKEYAIPAAAFAAVHGSTILFGSEDDLPGPTRTALDKRSDVYATVLAPEEVISPSVLEDLVNFGTAERIPGENPHEVATAFAQYVERGTDQRWWTLQTGSPRTYGWGVTTPGHNFLFAADNKPEQAIWASNLANRGTHGPLLWIDEENGIPEAVSSYLKQLRPHTGPRPEPLFNRGWIMGSEDHINRSTQLVIEEMFRRKND